jgi:hypothetical protein
MLWYLQRWARDHDISLKVFNPTRAVKDRLTTLGLRPEFELASLDEVLALLAVHAGPSQAETTYSRAA